MTVTPKPDEQFSEAEAKRRTEAALRAAFNTPPKPQSEMKLGKSIPKGVKIQSERHRKQKT